MLSFGYLARSLCYAEIARAHRDRKDKFFVLIFLEEKSVHTQPLTG